MTPEFLPLPLPQPPSELQLSGHKVWLRAPLLDDWRDWSALRGLSRDFLTPWEPTWLDDALTKAAFIRRLDRQYESWRLDMGYDFLIFRASDQALLGVERGRRHHRLGAQVTPVLGAKV